jgi:hypothetical protein
MYYNNGPARTARPGCIVIADTHVTSAFRQPPVHMYTHAPWRIKRAPEKTLGTATFCNAHLFGAQRRFARLPHQTPMKV